MFIILNIFKAFVPVLLLIFLTLRKKVLTFLEVFFLLIFSVFAIFTASFLQVLISPLTENLSNIAFNSFIESSLIEELTKFLFLGVFVFIKREKKQILLYALFLSLSFASLETLNYWLNSVSMFFRFFTSHIIHLSASILMAVLLLEKQSLQAKIVFPIIAILSHGLFNFCITKAGCYLGIAFLVEIVVLLLAVYVYKKNQKTMKEKESV